jgi:hypothetical protein
MNMRDADIRSLIQWVADITGKNLVVHKDAGKVTVLPAEPLTPAEAYQVFWPRWRSTACRDRGRCGENRAPEHGQREQSAARQQRRGNLRSA